MNRLRISDRLIRKADTFYVGIVTKGNGHIVADGITLPLMKGSKFLVPVHTTEVEFVATTNLEVILTYKELS